MLLSRILRIRILCCGAESYEPGSNVILCMNVNLNPDPVLYTDPDLYTALINLFKYDDMNVEYESLKNFIEKLMLRSSGSRSRSLEDVRSRIYNPDPDPKWVWPCKMILKTKLFFFTVVASTVL
jgi:hypothetical protein